MDYKKEERDLLKAELVISHILRWGVIACGIILIAAWAMALYQGQYQPWTTFIGSDMAPATLSMATVFHRALAFDPNAMISLGLFLLIALPVTRVATTLVLFIMEQDYIFMALSAFVLMILIFSLTFGKAL